MIDICLRCKRERLIYAKKLCHSCYVTNTQHIRRKLGKVTNKEREKGKENSQKYYKKNRKLMIKHITKYNKEYRKKQPTKVRAREEANNKLGKIPKGILCEECNKRIVGERHHIDYTKPLEVMFLCVSCHRKKHRLEYI